MGGQLMLVCGLVAVLLSPVILIDATRICGTIPMLWPFGESCGEHKPLELTKKFKRNARAGGLELEAKYFPSFVQLEFSSEGDNWISAGVLIGDRYVLSHQSNWERAREYGAVKTGAYKWAAKATLGLGSESETEIAIETDCPVIYPPKFIPIYDDDLILFRLIEKVNYDQNIQPACWYLDQRGVSEHLGLKASMQAFLVVSSAMDRPQQTDDCNEGRNDEEEEEPATRRRRTRPRGLRVLPVRRTSCPGESGSVPRLCAKPNLSSYPGSPCKDDFGAPLLATIDGIHHVFGFLKSKHPENCRANISRTDEYRIIGNDDDICIAAENCIRWFGE